MKKALLLIALCGSIVAMGMPAKPALLDSLLQAGDTARYNEMIHHQRVISTRVADVQAQRAARRVASQTEQAITLNLAPRGLVILVNFADQAFTATYDEMHEMINGENYTRSYRRGGTKYTSSGSARQYFIDQSWGQYQPQFDVVGPYTVSQNYSYYGANDASGNDKYPYKMIIEACQLADADGVDFTQYDNNNDGDLDFVFVIYAGYGEADGGAANTIWPHTYWVKDGDGQSVKVDGKYINAYACANELFYGSQIHTGIATFCHEFGHVLGLPDLYDTNGTNQNTVKDWDIMDSGSYNNDCNTPPAYSAYERFFLGWLTPTRLTGNKDVTLHPLNSSHGAGLISATAHNMQGNDPNPTTFYMIENREKTGWDAYLPGKGLIITKIQYSYSKWYQNTVNNTKSKLGVDIIEAQTNTSASGKASDAYPNGAFEYTGIENYSITNIGWSSTNTTDIEFTLNEGGFPLEIGTISTGVENVNDNDNHNYKKIVNGQVVIVRDGQMYDILGNKIQ